MRKYQQGINSVFGNKKIELDEQEIRIVPTNDSGVEVIDLNKIDKLILKKEYFIPDGSVMEAHKGMLGDTKENYLIVQQDNHERKLNFELDSHYMIKQLDKIIESWNTKGYPIERIT